MSLQESHSSMGDTERLNNNSNYQHETFVLLLVYNLRQACFLLTYIFPKPFFTSYLGWAFIDRYQSRPDGEPFDNMSLAHFSVWYNVAEWTRIEDILISSTHSS